MPNSDKQVTFREVAELADLVVTGELSLQETGRIVTSTDTGSKRVIMSATGADAIFYLSGSSRETLPAESAAYDMGGLPLLLLLGPQSDANSTRSYIRLGSTSLSLSSPGPLYLTGTVIDISPSLSTFDPDLGILTGTTVPTVGTGADALEAGMYTQMGSQIVGHFTIRWSSDGTSGNGTYRIRVPKKPASTLPLNPSLGSGRILSSTGSREWLCDIRMNTSRQAIFRMGTTGGLNVTDNFPAIWVNSSGNRITRHLSYLTTE